MLAAAVLGRHGLSVACVEMNPDVPGSQSHHVHLFAPAALKSIDAWIPGFIIGLVEHGAICVDRDGRMVAGGEVFPHPSRAVLDTTLRKSSEQQVVHAKVLETHYKGGSWILQLSDGSKLSGRRIVDASGQARRSLRGISANETNMLVLHEGPRTGSYLSAVVSQLDAPDDLGVLRIRGQGNTPGLLGVRLDESQWQLTLQFEAGLALPSWKAAVQAFPSSVRNMFRRHRLLTTVRRCGGQRSTYLDTETACRPCDWLPLGDALLCTPPYQGNGLSNIVSQLQCIDQGLESGSSFEQIRDQIWDEAQSLWMQATMVDTLSNSQILEALATA